MFENVKKYAIQGIVLVVNVALVGGGVSFFKDQQEKKDAPKELANNVAEETPIETVSVVDPVAEKAAQLQQIIDNNATQKNQSVAKNTGTVTVQKPKTVTTVIPGGTKTVTTSSSSSASSSKSTASAPAPAKTTKKS